MPFVTPDNVVAALTHNEVIAARVAMEFTGAPAVFADAEEGELERHADAVGELALLNGRLDRLDSLQGVVHGSLSEAFADAGAPCPSLESEPMAALPAIESLASQASRVSTPQQLQDVRSKLRAEQAQQLRMTLSLEDQLHGVQAEIARAHRDYLENLQRAAEAQ